MPAPIAAAAGMAARVLTGGGRALMGGGRAAGAGGRGSTLRSHLRGKLRSKVQELAREKFEGADTKVEVSLDVVLFINPKFVKDLEKSVVRSMGTSGQLWSKGIKRDMKMSTPRKKKGKRRGASQPGRAPAIQTRTLFRTISYKHDKPNAQKTKFTMYVGSVKNQKLKPWIPSYASGYKKWSKAGRPDSGRGRPAFPYEYGYWLEYGNKKFNVPFRPRPWAGPGSFSHNLWVANRFFVQDFTERMGINLRRQNWVD